MAFSRILQLTDLDDFIGPSQECIKPVKVEKKVATKKGTNNLRTSTFLISSNFFSSFLSGAKIKIRDDGAVLEELSDGSEKKLAKASITLADCLACSGCITSAESILIEQQSSSQLEK